jgi:excisionase family DNA binding protein
MTDREWLGTKEAAEAIGITLRTLYRLIDDGRIPAYQIGRVIRVRASDLERYLETVKIQPGDLRHLYDHSGVAADGDAGASY